MITIAEYISRFLSKQGLEQCFIVPGGGAMFINEALRKNKLVEVIPMHHEQACAMAAEGYTKLNNKPAILSVTTGPGSINALNGVYGAYTDSIPMFVLSGQVKRETYGPLQNKNLRQLGDQEVDIVNMVTKITKYSKTITNTNLKQIDQILEKAMKIMMTGRKGPVWIDVPIDIQSANVKIKKFTKTKVEQKKVDLSNKIPKVIKMLNNSKRPVVIVGSGIRLSGSEIILLKFLKKFNLPVVTTFNSHDLIDYENPLYVGRQGTIGDRSGNFAVQNADLLIILGSRLNIRQIGYNFSQFSPNSKKIMVDIDEEEINKNTLSIDLKINADLKYFLNELLNIKIDKKYDFSSYIKWAKGLQQKYPVIRKEFYKSKNINPYVLMELIYKHSKANNIIVTSDGTAAVMSSQALKIRKGQRLFSNSGSASMGYGLPASIGACYASEDTQKVICIEGDGSIQMNIQELATVAYNNLDLKIIIIENGGYLSIKQTQERYFDGNFIACGPDSGLGFPNLQKISKSYNIPHSFTTTEQDTNQAFKKYLHKKGPHIFIISVERNQQFEPKPSSKRLKDGRIVSLPLDDMAPHLKKSELEDIRSQASEI